MKTSLEIALQYIKHYKNKSLSILFSIILATALIVGIGTMYNSASHANMEKVRKETADYHYILIVNRKQYAILRKCTSIDNLTSKSYYDSAKDPKPINIVQADENYIKMFQSSILKGRMPHKKGEIALEEWVIKNLHYKPVIGEKVTFRLIKKKRPETFTLVGILKDIPENKKDDKNEGFIVCTPKSKNFGVYIKFKEQLNINKELHLLLKKIDYGDKDIYCNHELLDVLNVATYIPSIGTTGSIRYIIDHYHLDLLGIIFMISLFSAFVIYSVYLISTLQRISEYGLLKALGADNRKLFHIIFSELLILFAIGFPTGSLLGIISAKILNHQFSTVLIGQKVKSGQIYISTKSMLAGMLFLLILIIIIAGKMLRKLNKLTEIEAIRKNFDQKSTKFRGKKLYTLRRNSITNLISYKFIVRKKSAFIGILLSLSLGGIIFLCSDYAAELKRQNNDLSVKVDNDLNSDYQINMFSTNFDQGISDDQINQLRKVEGVNTISPILYYYGAIVMNDDRMLSKVLWDEENKDSFIKNSFGGMYTKVKGTKKQYLLRTGIYGYDNRMLNRLKDYILEGDINPGKMKQDNLILFKQIQDGGNGLYDMIDIKPGDTITVKFQKSPKITRQSLRFESGPEYIEKSFTVGATLKRVAASNKNFLGDSGEDIIMTNDQFKKEFGVNHYNMVSITKKKDAKNTLVADKLNQILKGMKNCSFRDLTKEIAQHNSYLNKQVMFLYGVTFILFIISLFNILNNIGFNVLSRMNEFGMLRATGITDAGFCKMILREGLLYGIFASIITIIGSLLGQLAVLFMVKTSYLYISPHFTINLGKYLIIILLNIVIALIATILPSLKILKMSIVEEIKKQE